MNLNQLFSRKKGITIQELLKGTSIGRMQSVGYMQVIPLLSDLDDDRFVSPNEIQVGTGSYGSLFFENPTDQLLIVPAHVGYVIEQRAQDHAMAHADIVDKRSDKTCDTAMCIQESQGGYMDKGKHKMLILPFSLREIALNKRKEKKYSKLWESITQFNKNLGAKPKGHLEYFLKKFKKELDEFVAEFESLPRQVGAIILLDGEVVGIERTPSYSYWKAIWPALIRECYGSLAIEYQTSMGEDLTLPKGRVALDENVTTLPELRKALEDAEAAMEEMAKEKIRGLLTDTFEREMEQTHSILTLETLTHSQFVGQIIHEKENILYASMIVKQQWYKQRAWHQAEPFVV